MNTKRIIILGCTGSIGQSTLEVCKGLGNRVKIVGLSAHSNEEALLAIGKEWGVDNMVLSGTTRAGCGIKHTGLTGLQEMIEDTVADLVINGISGTAGFLPSLSTIRSGKDLALANKETIIMGGELVKDYARKKGCKILPVDSEHSALQHLLRSELTQYTDELILTASGGPFREFPIEKLKTVTLKDALNHPTWNMGPKITIDSATLANKGLEVMEAHYLFNMAPDKLKVIVHPQSHVHSMIRTIDGVVYAQVSPPNMVHPIQNAITFPDIISSDLQPLDFANLTLTFHPVDEEKFPMLPMAYEALEKGGAYPLAYNAANELAVEAFLKEEISYSAIPELVHKTLQMDWTEKLTSIDQVIETDMEVRKAIAWELPGKEVV